MKFLHSSIQLSQKVLHAIPLTSTDQNIINALLIFRNYAQRIKIDCNESTPSVFPVAIYPLGVSIIHAVKFGELIFAVTSDAYAIFFSPDQPFKTIMNYKLSDGISPSQIPVAHVLPSINHQYIVCCGFSKNLVVIEKNEKELTKSRIELPDFVVLGIAQGDSDNIFAFLVMKPDGKRSVVFTDISSKQYSQIQEFPVLDDAYKIVSTYDGILVFSKGYISLLGTEKSIESSQISSNFLATPKCIIYQTIDGNMYGLKTSDFHQFELGSIHLSSLLYPFTPNLLLSVSEYSNCYFISFPTIDDHLDIQFKFEQLPKRVFHFTPRTIAATFNGRSLIVASGHENESSITQILNTIPYNRQYLVNLDLNDQDTQKLKLFSTISDSLILSRTDKTSLAYGRVFNYSENPTLEIGHLQNRPIQIHKGGINVIMATRDEEAIKWESPDEIVCAAIGEDSCFISMKNENRAIVLDSQFNIISDKSIGTVFSATYCGKSIAIAAKSDGTNHSAISIYSTDLNPGDSEIHLTSQVVSMQFNQSTMELFVSTHDGFVYKFSINENTSSETDLEDTIVTIYSGKVPPLLLHFCNTILIVAERIFVYNGQQLLLLSATSNDSKPLTAATFENNVFIVEKDSSLYVVTVEETDNDMTTNVFHTMSTPRRIANCGDLTLTVLRSKEEEFKSFISILKRSKKEEELFKITNIPIIANTPILANTEVKVEGINDIGVISFLVVPGSNQIILGCRTTKKDNQPRQIIHPPSTDNQEEENKEIVVYEYFLNIVEFNQTVLDNENESKNDECFVPVQIIPLEDSPNVISFINGLVLLGTGRHIYPMIHDGTKWKKQSALASIHTQVGFIEVCENFVWIGDKTQSIICFAFKSTDKKEPKLVPVAIDTQPKQLTAMKVINKYTIAVADKFGIITILRLPEDIIAGTPWRLSHPAERGVFMPPSGHLINLASFNVGETVTSLIKSDFSSSLFYTTLLGQIGTLIPISNEDEYSCLQTAENLTKQHWQKEFALMKLKKFEHSMISVVDLDFVEQLDQLSEEAQTQIENVLKANNKTIQQVMGILGKYKALCKF